MQYLFTGVDEMKQQDSFIKRMTKRVMKIRDRAYRIGFVNFIIRVMTQMGEDNGTNLAAAIAYYGFLSLFPLILGIIGLLGLFLPSQEIQQRILSVVQENLPKASDIVVSNIQNVIHFRGTLGIIAIIGLLWSGSGVMAALDNAINRAWDIPRMLQFYIRKPRDIGLTLGVGLLFLLSIGTSEVFSVVRLSDWPIIGAYSVRFGTRVISFLLIFTVFLILFKLMPNTKTYWRHVWPGALLTAIFFEVGRSLFVYYINNYTNYQLVYGTVGSIIAIMIWIYYSAVILILGAESTAEYSRMRRGVNRGVRPQSVAKPAAPPAGA